MKNNISPPVSYLPSTGAADTAVPSSESPSGGADDRRSFLESLNKSGATVRAALMQSATRSRSSVDLARLSDGGNARPSEPDQAAPNLPNVSLPISSSPGKLVVKNASEIKPGDSKGPAGAEANQAPPLVDAAVLLAGDALKEIAIPPRPRADRIESEPAFAGTSDSETDAFDDASGLSSLTARIPVAPAGFVALLTSVVETASSVPRQPPKNDLMTPAAPPGGLVDALTPRTVLTPGDGSTPAAGPFFETPSSAPTDEVLSQLVQAQQPASLDARIQIATGGTAPEEGTLTAEQLPDDASATAPPETANVRPAYSPIAQSNRSPESNVPAQDTVDEPQREANRPPQQSLKPDRTNDEPTAVGLAGRRQPSSDVPSAVRSAVQQPSTEHTSKTEVASDLTVANDVGAARIARPIASEAPTASPVSDAQRSDAAVPSLAPTATEKHDRRMTPDDLPTRPLQSQAIDPSSVDGSRVPQARATAADHDRSSSAVDVPRHVRDFTEHVTNALRTVFDTGGQMRVRLVPPELGTLVIEVSARGGEITARLEVQAPSAHQTILDNLSMLRDALAQTGTPVSRIDVEIAPPHREEPGSDRQDHSRDGQQKHNQGDDQRRSREQSDRRHGQGRPRRRSPSIDQIDIEV